MNKYYGSHSPKKVEEQHFGCGYSWCTHCGFVESVLESTLTVPFNLSTIPISQSLWVFIIIYFLSESQWCAWFWGDSDTKFPSSLLHMKVTLGCLQTSQHYLVWQVSFAQKGISPCTNIHSNIWRKCPPFITILFKSWENIVVLEQTQKF